MLNRKRLNLQIAIFINRFQFTLGRFCKRYRLHTGTRQICYAVAVVIMTVNRILLVGAIETLNHLLHTLGTDNRQGLRITSIHPAHGGHFSETIYVI